MSNKVKVKLGRQNLVSEEQRDAEMERLVYEEYETGMLELPALSLEIDNSRCGHLCCMRDREIEFFGRSLPSVN